MVTLGVAELKARLSQYLEGVKAGGEIVVTEHGRPIARILPLAREQASDVRLFELLRRGVARLPEKAFTPAGVREFLRKPRPTLPAGAVEAAIEKEREDRL